MTGTLTSVQCDGSLFIAQNNSCVSRGRQRSPVPTSDNFQPRRCLGVFADEGMSGIGDAHPGDPGQEGTKDQSLRHGCGCNIPMVARLRGPPRRPANGRVRERGAMRGYPFIAVAIYRSIDDDSDLFFLMLYVW